MGGSAITRYARANGLKIKDAKTPLDISVNKADLRGARKKDPANCAFAKACKRQEDVDEVFFFGTTAYTKKGKTLTRYLMPTSMQKEVVAFDRGGKFEPGEYNLKAPVKTQKLEARREYSRKISSEGRSRSKPGPHVVKDGSRRVKSHITTNIRAPSPSGK
jgi:hypothetical protein